MEDVGNIKVIYKGGFMSGDAGLEQPVIFYDKKMTETKIVLLSLKGIKFIEESEKSEWKKN